MKNKQQIGKAEGAMQQFGLANKVKRGLISHRHRSVLGSYEELEQFMRVRVRVVARVRMRVVGEYFASER